MNLHLSIIFFVDISMRRNEALMTRAFRPTMECLSRSLFDSQRIEETMRSTDLHTRETLLLPE